MDFLSVPLGYIIFLIHKVVANYGFSIIIFTVILKILMTPLYIKQQKSAARMSAFNPLISEINKKYRSNLQKRNEEIQKLYSSHNINPGAGCLTAVVPIFVLIGMFGVVFKPLSYALNMSSELINRAIEIFKSFEPAMFVGKTAKQLSKSMSHIQLDVINDVFANPSHYESLGKDFIDSVQSVDLNFLGFNLLEKANLTSVSIIIPILSLTFSFLQMFIMMKQNTLNMVSTNMTSMKSTKISTKIMMYVMPAFSFFIALSAPIGLAIYWITNYLVQIFQSLFLNKFCNCEEIRKQALVELENIRKNKKHEGLSNKQMKISSKERLNLARKHLQDKFGD